MPRPYALLRAGYPYVKTIGTKRLTDEPSDLAFGKDGRMYLLTWAPIKVMSMDEEDLGTIGKRALGDQKLGAGQPLDDDHMLWPLQIVADEQENLYVTDEGRHRIARFAKDGTYLGHWGEYGAGDGQFNRPSGIAFDHEGNVLVVDTLNHRVQKLSCDGRFITKWGSLGAGDGQLNMPWGIAVDPDGFVYVSDWRNDRIVKFAADGQFVFKFGKPGGGDGEMNRPMGIAVDKDFDIYVVDGGHDGGFAEGDDTGGRVQLFSPEGRYVQTFLGDATLSKSALKLMWSRLRGLRMREMTDLGAEKLFRNPKSVRVDNQGRMFVPDIGGFRVQIYQKEAYPLTAEQIGPALRAPTLSDN